MVGGLRPPTTGRARRTAACDDRPVSDDATPRSDGDETPKQRRDRELIELLNELRLAAPGVQVVFGFLLIVPFNSRFGDTTTFERVAYGTSLVLIALSVVLLLGASIQHRLLFRRHFEMRMLHTVNILSLVGLALLGFGMIAAVILVTHFLFGTAVAASIGSVMGVLLVGVWFVLPLHRARQPLPSAEDHQ